MEDLHSLDKLPLVVLDKVISYLTVAELGRLSQTCSLLNTFLQNPKYWRIIHNTRISGKYVRCTGVEGAVSRVTKCRHVEAVTLESLDSSVEVKKMLAALAESASCRLHRLELMRCSLTLADMKLLSDQCPHLTSIRMVGTKFETPHGGHRCHFAALQSLDLSEYCFFYEDNLVALFGQSCNLRRLAVGPNNIKKSEWLRLLPELVELGSLSLTRCSTVDDEVLAEMAESCSRLENVLFRQMPHLTVAGLQRLAQASRRLTNIDLLM